MLLPSSHIYSFESCCKQHNPFSTMDLVDDYIKQNPEQWQRMLDKYSSLKQMGQIGPDTQFVRGVTVHSSS